MSIVLDVTYVFETADDLLKQLRDLDENEKIV